MEYKMVSDFNERIKELHVKSGLNQQDFANKIGIIKSLLNRYLHRGDKPKYDKIIQISNNLNINPLWLMGCDVPINSIITPKDTINNIPLLENIKFDENIFSIKNIKGTDSNIINLDINYEYFYYQLENNKILVQIKSEYKPEELVVIINTNNDIKINLLSEIDDIDYKIIGKLICSITK